MRHQNSVFHCITTHIPWAAFDRLVEKHKADARVRYLMTRTDIARKFYPIVRSLRWLQLPSWAVLRGRLTNRGRPSSPTIRRDRGPSRGPRELNLSLAGC